MPSWMQLNYSSVKRMLLTLSAFALLLAAPSTVASLRSERAAPPLGAFVDVEGSRVHVLEAGVENKGNGRTIVLIHGATANLRDMYVALGESLSKRHHVLIVDRPGQGYSSRPENAHELNRQASLIKGAVDQFMPNKPVIVGQSFGGAVALSYTLLYQEEMSGLVLLAPVSHEWSSGVKWYNSLSATPIVGFLFRRLIVPIYGSFVGKSVVEQSFAPDAPPPDYYNRAGSSLFFRPKSFKSNAEDVVHLKRQVTLQQDKYGEIELPVDILTGNDDTAVSPNIHAKALARQIPGARWERIPDTGHPLHHTQDVKIIAAIEEMALQN